VKKVYSDSAAIIPIKTRIKDIGHKRTLTIAQRSQSRCINIAIINAAFENIKNTIKVHLSKPSKFR
jgi:uncharacterized membrane protein